MVDPSSTRILVVEDDEAVRRGYVALLQGRGYRVVAADGVREGLRAFGQVKPAAVLLDLRLPDGTGIDVLRALQRQAPATPVLVISGLGSVGDAVEVMRVGATDYLEKPVDRDKLLAALERVLTPGQLGNEADHEAADGARYGMVGRCEAMRRVYQLVEMAAPTKCRVLISGESGTGKELIARAIHALSSRRERAFVELNCAAIPSELIESELFGHVKGAFTGAHVDRKGLFEQAHGGTLFLDELGDMSLMTQAKLLRVLQEGEVTPVGSGERRPVDVRILAATSKDLQEEIRRGSFRDDLFHRVNVLAIAVPPLRMRRDDVPELAEHFVRLACVENDLPVKRLVPRALEYLRQLSWPGNVRELRNLMERVVVLTPAREVTHTDVMAALRSGVASSSDDEALSLREARARFERQFILDRLSANSGSLGRTAQELGIERTNLYRKMKQLGIPSPRSARSLASD